LAIRIKFTCKAVTERQGPVHPLFDANFLPVTDNCPDNDRVFRGIAGGQIHLVGLNEKCFEAGQDYWLDFAPAGKSR
jgi:hypothetical protein